MKGLLDIYLKILRSTFCVIMFKTEKEVRCPDVRCASIQHLTDYDEINYGDVQMLIKMNVQTINDDILKAYEPISPEINGITASAMI